MRRYNLEEIGDANVIEMPRGGVNRVVLAGATFALGLAIGMMLKDAAGQMYERTRNKLWHRGSSRTVEYDENLPETLTRREPAPDARQPRFGGTGAMGVSPAAARTARPEENR
jgi:hypothetical protein